MQLEYARVRNLPSQRDKMESTLRGYIHWAAGMFGANSAAIEMPETDKGNLTAQLHKAALEVLRELTMAVCETDKTELFAAFAIPPMLKRSGIRKIVTRIWPTLDDNDGNVLNQDAAALGLYAQTERLLQH